MKNIYVFTILFFIGHFGFAQQKIIDSLELQLLNPTNGQTTLENLIYLSYHYAYVNQEKGLEHVNKAIEIALKNKDSIKLAAAYTEKALNYRKLGNDSLAFAFYNNAENIYRLKKAKPNLALNKFNVALMHTEKSNSKNAIKILIEALELNTALKDTLQMGHTLGLLGYNYINLGDYMTSMKAFLRATTLLEQSSQQASLQYAGTQANMGILYQRIEKPDSALQKYQKALNIYITSGNQFLAASQYINIGSAYYDKGDYEKAIINFKKGNKISKKINNIPDISKGLSNIGTAYMSLKKYDKALVYLDSALILNKESKSNGLLAINYNNKAKAYLDLNDISKTLKYYDSCLTYAKMAGNKRVIWGAKLGISQARSKQNNYKTAYTTLEETRILKDSLLSDEKKEELAVLKAQYDFDKEKAVLEAEFQKDQALQEAKISRQVLIRNASIGGGTFLILTLGVGFLLWRKKREADYNAQLSSSKLQSLRAQINPHFIFNSLNSINDYVLKNEKQTASDYLGEFSIMVRTILENTEEEEIPLEEEIKFLKSYVALEQKRLHHNFIFNVNVDQTINTEVTLLPPSLLQPFIENSIWHGPPSKEERVLSLSFTKTQNTLICIIEDNGIGLSISDLKKGTSRKYFGMENVKNRLNLLKKIKTINADMVIKNREEGGVKIKVTLPLSSQI